MLEHSLYVDPDHRGRVLASTLLRALIDSTETADIWTRQSGVFPDKAASLRVHAKAGFRTIGTREKISRPTATGATSSSLNAAAAIDG